MKKSNVYLERTLIHCIDNQYISVHFEMLHHLMQEFLSYEHFGYDYKDYRKEYDLSQYTGKVNVKTALLTPIDFTKLLTERLSKC